jgi:MFS family permease
MDGAIQRADGILDRGQTRVFRLLWVFLPDTSVIRNPRVEQVLASRFFSDAGQQSLTYGAIIAVVRDGGTALDSALIGCAAILPPALFGLYGGVIADQLPKRIALGLFYALQAAMCFVVPVVFGTDLSSVLFLIFAVNLLGQVSGPSESAVLPLVTSTAQLASAASLVSLASNLGTAFGTAVLAPILVRAFGVEAVFFAGGIMLLLAASRVFDLPTGEPERKFDFRTRPQANVRTTMRWLGHERAVATMMFVAVLAGTASIVVQTLGPRYVQSVLGVDAADSVYVFAPSSLGLVAAMALTPALIRRWGERSVALSGFFIVTSVLFGLGFIDVVTDLVDDVNPLRLLSVVGIDIRSELRTAGLLAIGLGFGLALTAVSVQTYLNRRVPLTYQGRAFALQSVLKNGIAIAPLLTLGAAATVFGVRAVLIASPFVLLSAAVFLVWLSIRLGGRAPSRRLDVLSTYWEESDAPVSNPDDAAPASGSTPAEAEHDREHHPA